MHIPNSRMWQKERKIFCESDNPDRAKQDCALTNIQLVKQALRNDVSVPTHQGINEPMHNVDNPNPLRTPTTDLIDFAEYKANLQNALDTAVSEHTQLTAKLKQAQDAATAAERQAVTNPQV